MAARATEAAVVTSGMEAWEEGVLPVFYYNDFLVNRIGDPVGLNLFEPRYVEMCRRMGGRDPRFIFMLNYEDYQCKAGDVGFTIRVSSIVPQGGGRAYGISGVAEEMVAVACTWQEPNTNGLHLAKVWRLNPSIPPVPHQQLRVLSDFLELGRWTRMRGDVRWMYGNSEGALVLAGCNWLSSTGSAFLLAPEAPAAAARLPQAIAAAATPSTSPDELRQLQNLLEQTVQRVPSVDATSAVRLSDFFNALNETIRWEGRGTRWAAGLPEEEDPQPDTQPDLSYSSRLLRRVRLLRLRGMFAKMPSVRIQLQWWQDQQGDLRLGAVASNGSNVILHAVPEDMMIAGESADAAMAELVWRLNRPRLQLLQRAHSRGSCCFSSLREDLLSQVFAFIAVRPAETA